MVWSWTTLGSAKHTAGRTPAQLGGVSVRTGSADEAGGVESLHRLARQDRGICKRLNTCSKLTASSHLGAQVAQALWHLVMDVLEACSAAKNKLVSTDGG